APEGPGAVGAPYQERKKEDAQNRPVKIRPHAIDRFDQRAQLPRETRRRGRKNSPEDCGRTRGSEIVAVTRFLSEVALVEIDDRSTGQGVDFRGEAGHGRGEYDRQHDAEDTGGSIAEEEGGKDVVHLGRRLVPHPPP